MGKNQHVVPVDDRWGVKGEGNSRMTKTFDTQKEAIAAARIIAKKQESELIIHNKEGKIRAKDSYGMIQLNQRVKNNTIVHERWRPTNTY